MRNVVRNELLEQLVAVRERRKVRRKRRYHRSRLEQYRAELVALHQATASLAELQLWLWEQHRHRVSTTTIWRYLRQLPELGGNR